MSYSIKEKYLVLQQVGQRKDIAEGYKDNAEFLSIKYPKTADVFFKMSQSYVYDSDLERRRAENGYF